MGKKYMRIIFVSRWLAIYYIHTKFLFGLFVFLQPKIMQIIHTPLLCCSTPIVITNYLPTSWSSRCTACLYNFDATPMKRFPNNSKAILSQKKNSKALLIIGCLPLFYIKYILWFRILQAQEGLLLLLSTRRCRCPAVFFFLFCFCCWHFGHQRLPYVELTTVHIVPYHTVCPWHLHYSPLLNHGQTHIRKSTHRT